MKNLLFIFIILLTTQAFSQENHYKHLLLRDSELIFVAIIQSNKEKGRVEKSIRKLPFVQDLEGSGDTLKGRIYKCQVPLKEYRGEEFGASIEVRSPFDGTLTVIQSPGIYTVYIDNISFETWQSSRTSYSVNRKVVPLTEFAIKKNGKFINNPYKVKDIKAFEDYLFNTSLQAISE